MPSSTRGCKEILLNIRENHLKTAKELKIVPPNELLSELETVIKGARITTDIQHAASSTILSMDIDNDGVVDAVIKPGEGVSTEELLDILRGMVRALELTAQKEKGILKNIDKFEKTLFKEYKNEKAGKKKIANAFVVLERAIEKFGKKKLFTTEEMTELLRIIERIKESVIE